VENRTKTSQAYSKGQGNPNQSNYTMLYNGAIAFDFDELQAFNDDCMLVVLPRNFIALLESVLRFADGSPHLWRDVAGRKDPKWLEVKQFVANGRACLLMGCKVTDLNDTLKEMLGVQKYLLAALTDGVVRDHYYDPGHAQDFADKVGVAVDDLPVWDLNPLDGDILHPNMATFDGVGTNTVIDPNTNLPVLTTSRRMVEEVPSVFIYDGWASDMTMAELYVDTMYQNIWPKAELPVPTGTIPFTDALIENMERQDLALRHINAKLSRSGRVELNLQDEPQVRDPMTGKRMILTDFFAQNLMPWPVGAWPLMAFTHPSVFTAGAPNAQDVLGVMEGQLALDSWIGDSTARGLLAGFRPTIRLTEGLAPLLTFPAINFPLPGTLGTIQIPPIPLFAGTMDMYIPGDGGRGLADQLKLEEDKVEQIINVPGIGNVAIKWDMNRLMVKIPALPAIPGIGTLPPMLTNAFGRRYLMGLLPGVWTQIFPYIRTGWHQGVYDQTRMKESGLAQVFKDILQIQVPNPAYNPTDPANVQPPTIDGKTLAQLFWIEKQKDPDPFGKMVGGESFAELFWIKPNDPNYRQNIQSHAQILNFMQIQVEQTLRDLIQELHDCCAKGTLDQIKTVMDGIAQSAADLLLSNNALAKIQLLQYSSMSGEEVALDLPAINAIPPTLKTTAPNPLTEVTEQLVKTQLLNYSGLTGEEVDLDLTDPANVVNSTAKITSPTPFYTGTLLETNSISDILHIALLDDGSPIPDFNPLNAESKLDGIRTDINASTVHFTGNFQQLMEWFAGSFRSGVWNGLNPFSHESFFDLTRRSLNKPGALALNDKPYLEQFNESFTAWATDFGLFKDIHQAMKDCICAANGLLETIGENILGITTGGSTPITNNINVSPTPVTVSAPNVTVTPTVTVSNPIDLSALTDTLDCLVATQRAIVTVKGGVNPTGCDDIGSGGGGQPGGGDETETDCTTIENAVGGIIDVLDWLVWGVEMVGETAAGPIVSALSKFRWFAAVLVAAGLVEPSPAEEIVTLPVGLVAILTLFVEQAIVIGAAALREMVNQMKASKKQISDVICGEGEIDLKLDEVVESVVDALTDEATKEGIKIMLKKFLKAPDIKKVLL